MAGSTIALPMSQSNNLLACFVRLLPGLLLLTAVGWAGKFVERSIARLRQGPSPNLAEYRIRVVGDFDRLADREHGGHTGSVSPRIGDV